MNIKHTKKFLKQFQNLPLRTQRQAIYKEDVFKRYPFSKSLKTHKLKGRHDGYHAFSIDYNYRTIFRFINNNSALFIAIGTHSIYD